MLRQTCYFSGEVQGVGFRYAARSIASKYGISGYVRNLDDGRVEMVMEGSADPLHHVIQELQDRMKDNDMKMDSKVSPYTGEFKGFTIRQ